jgi:hypothetical protein
MVEYSDFVAEVKRERVYFEAGGTSWRRQVSSISEYIVVQSPIRNVDYFCDKKDVVALVKDLAPNLDSTELIESIGYFLNRVAKDMIFKSELSNEAREHIEMQKKKREGKPLRFKDKLVPLAKGQKIRFSDIQAFPEKTEIINGEPLWSDEEKKAFILGVLTSMGLSYLVSVLPEHSLEQLRYIICSARRKTSNEIKEEDD